MRKRVLLAAAIVIAGTVLVVRLLHVADLIHIGAGYTAEQTCACVFVSHRSPESCRGTLDAVGAGVVSLKVGDRVLALTRFGGYSDTIVAPEVQVLPMPSRLTFE